MNELLDRIKSQKYSRKRKCRTRNREKGSVLSEAGPAMFILFIFAVFPVIDIIFIGISYCACSTLNSLQLREVAKTPSSQAKAAAQTVEQRWMSSGLGSLAVSNVDPSVSITYNNGEDNPIGTDVYVNVATTFSVRPLLTIPFFPGVPGLGAPMQWTVRGQRLMENPHYAAE